MTCRVNSLLVPTQRSVEPSDLTRAGRCHMLARLIEAAWRAVMHIHFTCTTPRYTWSREHVHFLVRLAWPNARIQYQSGVASARWSDRLAPVLTLSTSTPTHQHSPTLLVITLPRHVWRIARRLGGDCRGVIVLAQGELFLPSSLFHQHLVVLNSRHMCFHHGGRSNAGTETIRMARSQEPSRPLAGTFTSRRGL